MLISFRLMVGNGLLSLAVNREPEWPQLPDFLGHFIYHLRKSVSFRRRDPFKPQATGVNSESLDETLKEGDAPDRLVVALLIVTVSKMTTHHNDSVRSKPKCLKDENRVHSPAAHRTYHPDVWRGLDPGYAGQIGPSI